MAEPTAECLCWHFKLITVLIVFSERHHEWGIVGSEWNKRHEELCRARVVAIVCLG